MLVSTRFRLYTSSDIVGAELAAAYCRVIAMACGVLSELGLGHSLQATLFSRGLAEMGRFVAHRGGKERTTFGLAGSGNLFVDIGHDGSEDFRIGAAAMKRNRFDAQTVRSEYGDRGNDLLELIASLSALRSNRKLALHLLETCHLMVSGEMDPAVTGGFTWLSLAYSLWEGFMGTAMVIVVLVWCRDRLDRQGRLLRSMSAASYAVYVLHPLLIVPLALALSGIRLDLSLKFVLVAPLAVALCFLVGYVIRKLPVVRSIL